MPVERIVGLFLRTYIVVGNVHLLDHFCGVSEMGLRVREECTPTAVVILLRLEVLPREKIKAF